MAKQKKLICNGTPIVECKRKAINVIMLSPVCKKHSHYWKGVQKETKEWIEKNPQKYEQMQKDALNRQIGEMKKELGVDKTDNEFTKLKEKIENRA